MSQKVVNYVCIISLVAFVVFITVLITEALEYRSSTYTIQEQLSYDKPVIVYGSVEAPMTARTPSMAGADAPLKTSHVVLYAYTREGSVYAGRSNENYLPGIYCLTQGPDGKKQLTRLGDQLPAVKP